MDSLQTLLHSPAGRHWRAVGTKPHHGINLPLFSLRSSQSCGIGEFPDLLPLLHWCKGIGYDVVQLLPLNDTGPETSPYCALSASALNPLHLGLAQLPFLEQVPNAAHLLKELQALNTLPRLNYRTLHSLRETFLKQYCKQVGAKIMATHDYLAFLSRYPWLPSYANFKAIKSERQWEPWESWPQTIQGNRETISYHCLIQYLCFKQLQEVKKAAEELGIFLKGDIPILINRESADVWQNRSLFRLEYEAGASPDMYAKEGQKWGFPLYNWEEMEKTHFEWWKQRLDAASKLYHLYRLDHVVGFFRIWAIPHNRPAREGRFIPPDPAVWIAHGEEIMRMMLLSCPLLPIGEDLGTVPNEVRSCLKSLGICGTKVMRWERNWERDKSFIPYDKYPLASMTTVSTHDSETVKLWWRNHPDEAKEFARFKGWKYAEELTWEQHRAILYDSHHTASLFHINLLNEYFALVPGMTWDDERINMPGVVLESNWTYRFRPSVEEIVTSKELSDIISTLHNF